MAVQGAGPVQCASGRTEGAGASVVAGMCTVATERVPGGMQEVAGAGLEQQSSTLTACRAGAAETLPRAPFTATVWDVE